MVTGRRSKFIGTRMLLTSAARYQKSFEWLQNRYVYLSTLHITDKGRSLRNKTTYNGIPLYIILHYFYNQWTKGVTRVPKSVETANLVLMGGIFQELLRQSNTYGCSGRSVARPTPITILLMCVSCLVTFFLRELNCLHHLSFVKCYFEKCIHLCWPI